MPRPTDLPTPTPRSSSDDQVFWDGLAEDRLLLPRCTSCGSVFWHPRPFCPECSCTRIDWFAATGNGTIYSYSVTHKAPGNWGAHAPYVIAYVELDEGPRVMSNIVDADLDMLEVGLEVQAVFHAGADGGAVLRFTPSPG
ncbi:MAG: Zn-ribbon domain-containing OB-fold protein [Actinomycetia bacterium]|nr:Zn-ribbon domain-containing OB-fold protein [Actinomycetes bacterium]MCP4962024.1 Zn-ribbon domain-containing OB-fold protein [Actinomycetes bacterium]